MLDRALLEAIQPRTRVVAIGDDEVTVRSMLGCERDEFEEWVKEKRGIDFWAGLLQRTLVNPDGSRMFGDDEVEAVRKLPFTELEPAFEAAMNLNGLDKSAQEEIAKNSESDRNGDSTSGSRYVSG